MYSDLRNWLQIVEQRGELKRISGVDCNLEMSAINEILAGEAVKSMPALWFDKIPGYPESFSTLFGITDSPTRIALAWGLPEDDVSRLGLLRNWRSKAKEMKLIPPRWVTSGAVQANVDEGDRIDLLKFPTPRFHELDGGRYIGTCCGVIQKDPDSGWVNTGTYRCMLVDRRRVALHILEGQHGSLIMNKYFKRGQKMPVAIGIGLDPALWLASGSTSVPSGVSEIDYAGGIKGEPLEVFKSQFSGLPLPCSAEIIIEGECTAGNLVEEGPFGEWHGYYGNLGLKPVLEPVIDVKAVYYRDNPILTCASPMMPYLGNSICQAISYTEGILKRLEAAGIPGVKGAWCYSDVAGDGLFTVVAIEQLYAGHSREAGLIASQYPRNGRYTIVVEEDIDPSDLKQVIWALTTRGKPHEAIEILHHCRSTSADPTIPLEEKLKYNVTPKPLHTSRVVIDACRPLEWKKDWYPINRISPELREKVINKVREITGNKG
jgi:UbiD family decarboxylase